MTKVFLREKKKGNGKRDLYLDFYPPIKNPETGKFTRRQFLKMEIFESPANKAQREYNKETKMLAENIRAQRQIQVHSEDYGFLAVKNKQKKDFLEYFSKIAESKLKGANSKSNYENWLSVLKYLKKFCNDSCIFKDVTEDFCQKFKDFLLEQKTISHNTAATYFDKFKAVTRQAAKEKLLAENPAADLKSIKPKETPTEYLTIDELKQLSASPYPKYDELCRAALFSALTGMAFADLEKLTWQEVKHIEAKRCSIQFKRKKTDGLNTLPINKEAFELLGQRGDDKTKVFPALKYSKVCYHLPKWIAQAGILRRITFHAFRHSFATVLLSKEVQLYTISKLLGHKNIQTTQRYARVIDRMKQDAADKISIK